MKSWYFIFSLLSLVVQGQLFDKSRMKDTHFHVCHLCLDSLIVVIQKGFNNTMKKIITSGSLQSSLRKSSNIEERLSDYNHKSFNFDLCNGIQTIIGVQLLLIALVGFIGPLWFYSVFEFFAGISIVSGLYLIYSSRVNLRKQSCLINQAIARIVNDQN